MADSTSYSSTRPPTLLAPRTFDQKDVPPLSIVANDIASKILLAKDMWSTARLMAEIAQGVAAPGPLELINAAFFVASITPDVLKPPYTYYSGGFERPSQMTYFLYGMVALELTTLSNSVDMLSGLKERLNMSGDFFRYVQPPDMKALYEFVDKASSAVEQGLKLGKETESWPQLSLSVAELYKKLYDAIKASEELGNSLLKDGKKAEPPQRIEPSHPEGLDYPKSDERPNADSEHDDGDSRGLPSPSEDSEFDG
jgi:hypothetical protein